MAIRIRTTGIENYLEDGEAYLKALIIGKPKVGKTRSAAFWPKPFFIDFDGEGVMSLADMNLPYATVDTTDDAIELLDHLARDAALGEEKRRFKTLVVDTLDSFQKLAIQERLRETGKAGLSGWEDWGWLDAKMNAFMGRVGRLKMHVVCNVHIKTSEVDDVFINSPKLKGDMRDSIAGDFSLVGNMATDWESPEGERVLKRWIHWESIPGFEILGDRSFSFPAKTPVNFAPSDFTQLMEAFEAKAKTLKPGQVISGPEKAPEVPPAAPDQTGGPVTPARTTVTPPAAAKKATEPPSEPAATRAVPPAPKPEVAAPAAAAPATPGVVPPTPGVETSGTGSAPAPAAPVEPTTPVVAPATPEPSVEQAVATVQETLGGEVVPEAPPVDAAPAAEDKPPLICGTAGKLKSGEINPAPVAGCGGNINEIVKTPEDRAISNTAFLRTRTFLCPPCFAASEVA